ncbi:MAG: DedA family protein, partial [Bacteriovoracaceae bacterium]|nr:DedA family protein [Bacteriovoracaceae bacterium]
MEYITFLIDFILHIEVHLDQIIRDYQSWTYGIIFLIIFLETGVVVTPFLPGDSLLFALGAFAAKGSFDFWIMSILLIIAAIIGDSVNYSIGRYFGKKFLELERIPLIKKAHIEKAHKFYEKHGPKTIILARFIPIVRTFAPFVAGVGEMNYSKFMSYNVVGAILWVMSFMTLGYIFGNLEVVQSNFKLVILA